MVKIIVNYDRFVTILVIEWDQHDTIPAYKRHVLAQITLILMDLMIDLIVE